MLGKKLISHGKKQIEKSGDIRLKRNEFSALLGEVWKESMLSKNVISGFVSTGVFPVDSTKFPEELFHPKELREYKNSRPRSEDVALPEETTNYERPNSSDQAQNPSLQGPSTTVVPCVQSQIPVALHVNTPEKSMHPVPVPKTPNTIIEIFTTEMKKVKSLSSENTAKKPRKIPRLKAEKYGEVLTTEEVLIKVKENEEKRKVKDDVPKKMNAKKTLKAGRGNVGLGLKRKLFPVNPRHFAKKKNPDLQYCEDSDNDDQDSLALQITRANTQEILYEEPQWRNIKQGRFILADFRGGPRNTTHYKYVCWVVKVDDEDGEITVNGYRRSDELSTQFMVTDNDVSVIQFH